LNNLIYPSVIIGAGTKVEEPSIVGKPAQGMQPGERRTSVGENSVVRPFTTIYAGVIAGDELQTGQGVTVREDNIIGKKVSIGTNSVLECGNRIGDRVRIHTGCFLELVTIEDDVFIGANVVFTDDPHPPCPRYKECRGGVTIKRGAKIGANSTILPGVTIGERSLIGAGSVVTADVPADAVAVGNPARVIKRIDQLECETGFYTKPYEWMNE
jgi:acetyltransferase-like isoleucine patch superfamily enzyme